MRATATASTDSASTTGLAGRDHLAPPAGRPGRPGRGEDPPPYREDFAEASKSYSESAKETSGQAADAARKVMDGFRAGFNRG